MKLRYQMRGLGIGMIVTALLMGVALDGGKPLTDAEIRILAAELGMVESDSLKLSDVQESSASGQNATGKEAEASKATAEPTATPTEQPTAEPTNEPTVEPTMEPTAEPTIEPTAEPTSVPTREPKEEAEAGEMITIVVKSGANSYSVSKLLAEAGLVESAGDYDKYLCVNGYAERIQVGTFEIPMGSGYEKIAKIITKTK